MSERVLKKWGQGGNQKWDHIEWCKNLVNNLIFPKDSGKGFKQGNGKRWFEF